MKNIFLLIILIFTLSACVNKIDTKINKKDDVFKLTSKILAISSKISSQEAKDFSKTILLSSKNLAHEYEVVKPAIFHNTLINLTIKKRGFCYHYANDLLKILKTKNFKTFEIKKIVANRGEYFEHTSLLLTRKDISFENSIVLDAWRNAGDLYFDYVKNDKRYVWELK